MTISILSTLISSTKYNLSFPTKSYRNIGYIFVFQYFRLEFGYVLYNASAIGILYNYKNPDLIKVLNKTILTFDHCLVMIVDSMRTIKFRHRDQSPHNSGNLYWNILAVSSHHLEMQNLVKLSSAQQLLVTWVQFSLATSTLTSTGTFLQLCIGKQTHFFSFIIWGTFRHFRRLWEG